MDSRLGVGPVFVAECQTRARRWQLFATRVLFVGLLLGLLSLIWWTELDVNRSIRTLAQVGSSFFYGIASIELLMVLLVAPAATAGSICLDRSRGTLAHMLVTDLSSAEVVLGKLAARLLPTLLLLVGTMPIVAMATLLGGIDPVAMTGASLVSVGVAVLGSSLALTLSIWGRKPHEVLMATYALLLGWILFDPIWSLVHEIGPGVIPGPPDWVGWFDPFWLAFAPYEKPGALGLGTQSLFLLGCLTLSTALAILATLKIRSAAFPAPRRRKARNLVSRVLDRVSRPVRWLPGPSLDRNPVLWRHWHYGRPSGWTRLAGGAVQGFCYLLAILLLLLAPWTGDIEEAVMLVMLLHVFVGLLFVALQSPMALVEERSRGSLDVLLTTPLSSASILWGKWWGGYRQVIPLVFLPALVTIVASDPERRAAAFFLCCGTVLAAGALLTSFGLVVSLVSPRLGRALGITVGTYVVLSISGYFLVILADSLFHHDQNLQLGLAASSPSFGVAFIAGFAAETTNTIRLDPQALARWQSLLIFGTGWILLELAAALALFGLGYVLFDRCLGRVREYQGTRRRSPGALPPKPARPGFRLEPA